MANQASNLAENSENAEAKKASELKDEGKDILGKTEGSVDSAVTRMEVGSAVGTENAETGESLGYSEGEKRKKGDGDIKHKRSKKDEDDAARVRASIVQGAGKVTQSAMKRAVKIAIDKEIRVVQNEVHKLSKDAIGNAFELSEALKKLKKLKFIMKNLAHWAADVIKAFFQRIKNGEKMVDAVLPSD